MPPAPCPPHPTYSIDAVVRAALEEDSGGIGDVTTESCIPASSLAVATFLAKAAGVLAGRAVADRVFALVDPALIVTWTVDDGAAVVPGQQLGSVRGSARSILVAERVALNFLQRMSGIATAASALAVAAAPARVLDTRKTAPGLRLLDKWAVALGGGENHRLGLYDLVLIKDNHVDAAGGLAVAVGRARAHLESMALDLGIEVEVRTLDEVRQALACCQGEAQDRPGGRGRIVRLLLDNMAVRPPGGGPLDVSLLQAAVDLVGGRVPTEASGNVTLATAAAVGATGVTYVSSGALTHSVEALDISLKITLNL